jgi:hypothetical protein
MSRLVHFFARPTPLSMAVAALFIGLLVTAMAFMAPPFYRDLVRSPPAPGSDEAPVVVATLSGLHDVVWANEQIGPRQGMELAAGQALHLESGLAEITFHTGSRVLLQGPAQFVVQGDNAARLSSGKLVARVPAPAIGFTVKTPAAVITDLGTEFGVDVQAGQVEAHVFVGEVLVQGISPASDAQPIRLSAGKAVRVAANGRAQPQPADSSHFLRRPGLVNLARGKAIISAGSSWSGRSGEIDARYVPDHVVDGRSNDAPNSYWIGAEAIRGDHITIDLGGTFHLQRIELVATHNGVANDRGTKDFELWAGSKINGDLTLAAPLLIASGTLPDAAGTGARLPVYVVSQADGSLKSTPARYLHFVSKTFYGHSGGLNEIRVFGVRPD